MADLTGDLGRFLVLVPWLAQHPDGVPVNEVCERPGMTSGACAGSSLPLASSLASASRSAARCGKASLPSAARAAAVRSARSRGPRSMGGR